MLIANNRRTELLAEMETHRLLQAEAEKTLRAFDGTMAREDNLPAPRVKTQKQVADESRQSENFRIQSNCNIYVADTGDNQYTETGLGWDPPGVVGEPWERWITSPSPSALLNLTLG